MEGTIDTMYGIPAVEGDILVRPHKNVLTWGILRFNSQCKPVFHHKTVLNQLCKGRIVIPSYYFRWDASIDLPQQVRADLDFIREEEKVQC